MRGLSATVLHGMVGGMKPRRFPPLFDRPAGRWLSLVVGLGFLMGSAARVFWLSYPAYRVFDEVYFPVFAKQYLDGVNVFDVHPPLGKFFIALGVWAFGDGGIGWRIVPLLFGFACVWVVGALWYRYTRDRLASVLAAFLVAIDGMFIAYSRVGLMDGILVFFMLATLLLMLNQPKRLPLLGVATLFGLTISIKWVGAAVVVPLAYLAWRQKRVGEWLFSLWWSAAVYVMVVGVGEWLDGSKDVLESIVKWNADAAHYHAALTATHPYASPWWSWPLLERPVLFIYDAAGDGAVQVMTTLGNPLLWWGSGVAVLGSVGYLLWLRLMRREPVAHHPLVLPLLGWGASFLPWALVDRVVFLYHYLPAYAFALLMVGYWLAKLFRSDGWSGVIVCSLLLAVSLYFLPLAVGWWPLSAESLGQHIWIRRWLY